jgi:hypothetical protein
MICTLAPVHVAQARCRHQPHGDGYFGAFVDEIGSLDDTHSVRNADPIAFAIVMRLRPTSHTVNDSTNSALFTRNNGNATQQGMRRIPCATRLTEPSSASEDERRSQTQPYQEINQCYNPAPQSGQTHHFFPGKSESEYSTSLCGGISKSARLPWNIGRVQLTSDLTKRQPDVTTRSAA